jgi:HAE1 family hydrophobic/amphiphilic exporter-1
VKISAWSIRHPIPPIVLFLLLTVAGLVAFARLGIDENPNIDVPLVSVSINQLGAAPIEMEGQVTRKVEDAISGISGVRHITSAIHDGLSMTTAEFELGMDTDRAVNDVRDAVARIRQQLPGQINEPQITRVDLLGEPLATYTVAREGASLSELSWEIDNTIGRALLAVSGVGQVQRSGGVEREIRVDLDPEKLDAYGVTADLVNQQLRVLNIDMPGGRTRVGAQEQSIRTLGSAPDLERLEGLRIPSPRGGWIALGQLGSIVNGFSEPRQGALLDGKPVVAFQVMRSSGSNLVEVASGVDAALRSVQSKLPRGTVVSMVRTSATHVLESYQASLEHLWLGAGLAVLVIYWFLRDWRAAAISAVAMPLSVIPTFFVMKAVGFSLNNMSLLGLALVVGILVDDAIVEIENIARHMQMGKDPYRAALEAADEIGLAVVATTASILVVFVPVAFMGGIPGQFFRQFGLTVAVAVFFSLVVARLLTPLMAAYWMVEHPGVANPRGRLVELYDRLLSWALNHRLPTVLLALIFFLSSVVLASLIPTNLMGTVDRSETLLTVELPPGSSLQSSLELSRDLTAMLLAHKEVQQVFASVGTPTENGPRESSQGAVDKASLYVSLLPRDQRSLSQSQLEENLAAEVQKVPGVRLSFGAASGFSGRLSLVLSGENGAELNGLAARLVRQMRALPGLYDITSSAALQRPEILVRPDFDLAAEQGVSVSSLARTALVATLGDNDQNLAKFELSDRQVNIRVQLDPARSGGLETIRNLKVLASGNRLLPLSALAQVEVGQGPAQIDRYDRSRKVGVEAALRQDYALSDALRDIHQLPIFEQLPESVSESPAGDAEIQRDFFAGFATALGAAVLLIYSVLVLLFSGFVHPFTIMMALPLSLGGAVLGLLISGEPLGMYALIGIVMLMGLTTKNSILLVEYVLTSMARGVPRRQALFEAGEARMRPILMTTVAMVAGMLPIALGLGAGAEVRKSMAIAVIGGLFTSTLLTLIVVPVVFSLLDELLDWGRGRR